MNQKNQMSSRLRAQKGFTITELTVVLVLIAVLAAVSVPPLVKWINNAKYRASARTVLSLLRETRSRAINCNLEHRVEFESDKRRYRVIRGNRPSNSSDWNTVVCDWTFLPSGVNMHATAATIHINPNGTSNAGSIDIQNEVNSTKFEVRIASTGRIRMANI